MNGYIERLLRAGVPLDKAEEIYLDYVRNFSLGELEIEVRYKEEGGDVGRVESEPDRPKSR